MRVNVDLLRVLARARERAFVVVATDNVDTFADVYRRLAARPPGRPMIEPDQGDTLAAWASACDDLVCSSDVGVLKAGDPAAFFGPYLAACGLGFGDALLIDDRSDNCLAFRRAGGTALRWTMHTDPLAEVVATLGTWLGGDGAPPAAPRAGDDGPGARLDASRPAARSARARL
jgi:hypothetical protein